MMQLGYPEILLSLFTFIILYIHYKIKNRINPLVPIDWPIFGMLPTIVNLHNFYQIATETLRDHACTFLFKGPWLSGMTILFTCDPADIQHIFNLNFSNYPKGEEFAQIFDILGNGIFNADEDSWKKQRAKAHKLINERNFRAFVARSARDKVKDDLLPFLSKIASDGKVVDLQDVFLRLTFDTTSLLVFGEDPRSLTAGHRIPFATAMDDAMSTLFLRHCVPPAVWKVMRWMNVGPERRLKDAWRVIDEFVAERIAERKKKNLGRHPDLNREIIDAGTDLLSSYIDDGGDNDHSLRDTTVNFMLAGRDTTGVALSWFFWLLSQNPMVEAKILDELRAVEAMATRLNNDEKMVVFSCDEVGKMVYLHAALCEALRLCPPVPLEHKGALKEDVLPSGHKVGPWVQILVPIYCMGRMEGIWGKDCMEFRPERWINEAGRVRHEPTHKFLSFNSGPRTCLGKDVAFAQMKAVVANVVYNFCVDAVEGHVVEPKLSIILHMRDGFMVRVRRRVN